MKRKFLPWIFSVFLLIIMLAGTNLPSWMIAVAIIVALISDLIVVRISLLVLRLKLENKGLDLGQVIPSTLIIFGWLIYAVVQFQIFLSMMHYLDLPSAALKWVFPLTAFKALWPVYYLGSKLPSAKKEVSVFFNVVAYQIPWAIGGAFVWYTSNATENFKWQLMVYTAIIFFTALLPSLLRLRIK